MARLAVSPAWIFGPRFDVAVFFAPACVALGVFALCALAGVSPFYFLWVWLLAFDGPHMLAAYTRAYGDPEMWRTRRGMLLGTLGAFLVGPAILVLGALLALPWLFTAFLAVMTAYSYYHLVRQHWGFVAIYGARARTPASPAEKRLLYAACAVPYLAFVLSHPALGELAGTPPGLARLGQHVAWALCGVWLLLVARLAVGAWRAMREHEPVQKHAYLLTATVFHGLVYFVVARFEPMFSGAVGLDQQFMVLAIVSGMFHSAEYVGLVGLYHARSNAVPNVPPSWFFGRPERALLCLVPFVLAYFALACATGVYPGCQVGLGTWMPLGISLNQLALSVFWGMALQHYWLDERIWRISADPRLRRILASPEE